MNEFDIVLISLFSCDLWCMKLEKLFVLFTALKEDIIQHMDRQTLRLETWGAALVCYDSALLCNWSLQCSFTWYMSALHRGQNVPVLSAAICRELLKVPVKVSGHACVTVHAACYMCSTFNCMWVTWEVFCLVGHTNQIGREDGEGLKAHCRPSLQL